MKRFSRLLSGAIVATSVVAPGASASAEGARHGWYMGLDLGGSFVNDVDLEATPNSYSFDTGWAILGAVGYRFTAPIKLELEVGLRDNDVGEINGVAAANGELRELTGFANVLWDGWTPASNWGLTVGVGLGIDNARFKDHVGVDSREVVPAVQGIIGLTYRLSDHWEYALNYRLLYADQGNYETTVGLGTLRGETDLIKHTLTLGFRYGYDDPPPPPVTAPPPPPPSAAPPPAKQFIVFFGFGKSNLTPEAQAVVNEAAAAAKAQGAAKITIVGHTDTAGSSASNDALSMRRASAVKDELGRLGISRDAITASGKGETELMVHSGDGVKEPQNRRATINLD